MVFWMSNHSAVNSFHGNGSSALHMWTPLSVSKRSLLVESDHNSTDEGESHKKDDLRAWRKGRKKIAWMENSSTSYAPMLRRAKHAGKPNVLIHRGGLVLLGSVSRLMKVPSMPAGRAGRKMRPFFPWLSRQTSTFFNFSCEKKIFNVSYKC